MNASHFSTRFVVTATSSGTDASWYLEKDINGKKNQGKNRDGKVKDQYLHGM